MDGAHDMLRDRKHAPAHLGRVLVLGLGKSGRAVSRYCLGLLGTRVEALTVAGGVRNDDARAFADNELSADAVEVMFDTYDFEHRYDLCIASPGISQFSDFYRNARNASTELIGEVEFAWRESRRDTRWIAITGTNGKTTTTALTAHILRSAGMAAVAVGNIGETCLEAVAADTADVYVVETSSYQLASTIGFAPHVAVILNITPDHLTWHRSHEAYVSAKLKILENLADVPGALAVLDATDDAVREIVRKLKATVGSERGFDYVPLGAASGLEADMRQVCGSDNAAFLDGGMLCVCFGDEEHRLVPAADLTIKGLHNVANALASSTAALAVGADDAAIRSALCGFKALEHRIEPCGSIQGVACYNDSKATNVDATLKALSAFEGIRPIVLLGGDDKGTALDDLVAEAQDRCKAVVCFGEAGSRFFEAFDDAGIQVLQAGKLEAALDCALAVAEAGDAVVLSPACASFDEFASFEQRGTVFKELVARRSSERGA